MNSKLSTKSKTIWLVIISIILISLAILVYLYQVNLLQIRADVANPTYSKVCLDGKINGTQTKKCYSNDENDGNELKQINDTLNLEIGTPYTLEFTLGDFREYFVEGLGQSLPIYRICHSPSQQIGWIWDWGNATAGITGSLVCHLDVALYDINLFDKSKFSNVSGQTYSVRSSVDNSKTLGTLNDTDILVDKHLFGYSSNKDKDDLDKYDSTLAAELSQCGPEIKGIV